MTDSPYYTLDELPIGTVALLETGIKVIVIHITQEGESIPGEKRLLFLTSKPTLMWKSNHNAPGYGITELLGTFSGEVNEM